MNVTVLVSVGGGTPTPQELTVDTFTGHVAQHCDEQFGGFPFASCNAVNILTTSPSGCDQSVCFSYKSLCVAHLLQNVAHTASEFSFAASGVDYTLIPQDAESSAALAERSFQYAARGVSITGEELNRGSGVQAAFAECFPSDLATTFTQNGATPTYGQAFADTLVEGLRAAEDAAASVEQFNVAVADAEFARTPDSRRASRFGFADSVLSRSRAAHVLLGGDWSAGVGPYDDPAAIPQGSLSDGAKRALQLIRLAAPHPAHVVNLPSFPDDPDAVANATLALGPLQSGASLTIRLEEILGVQGDPAQPWQSDYADFLERFQFTDAELTEARHWLAFELKAHRKQVAPPSATGPTLPPMVLSGGFTTGNTRHAGTAVPPIPLPAAAFTEAVTRTTAARDDRADSGLSSDGFLRPGPGYAQLGLAELRDYGGSVAGNAVNPASGLAVDLQNTLASVAVLAREQQPVRLEVCYGVTPPSPYAAQTLRLRVYGTTDAPALRLVQGLPGLSCGTHATVDGADCDLAALTITPSGAPQTGVTAQTDGIGLQGYVELTYTIDPAHALPLFLLRAGVDGSEAAGSYSPLGVALSERESTGTSMDWNFCQSVPVDPELATRAQLLLEPSVEKPAFADGTCAGLSQQQRIPLENELSSDGDAYESSWKSYLALARHAADEADRLGEEIVALGLDMDRRSEAAVEELASLCGGPISLDGMLDPNLATPTPGTEPLGASCTANQEGLPCTTSTEYRCINGRCVRDPRSFLVKRESSDPGAGKLLDCMGGGTLDFVALGDDPVCVWREKGVNAHRVCGGASSQHPCPFWPDGASCPTPDWLDPATHEVVTVGATLGLFDVPESDKAKDVAVAVPCKALRHLRAGNLFTSEANLTGQPNIFSPSRIQGLARRLGFRPKLRDFVDVTWDGRTVFSTGDAVFPSMPTPSEQDWPCGQPLTEPAGPGCDTTSSVYGTGATTTRTSLACSYVPDCNQGTADTDRVSMNHRLMRAVIALRYATGTGMSGVTIPFVHKDSADSTLGWALKDEPVPFRTGPDIFVSPSTTRATSIGSGSIDFRFVPPSGSQYDDGIDDEFGDSFACYSTTPARLWTAFHSDRTRTPSSWIPVPLAGQCDTSSGWKAGNTPFVTADGRGSGSDDVTTVHRRFDGMGGVGSFRSDSLLWSLMGYGDTESFVTDGDDDSAYFGHSHSQFVEYLQGNLDASIPTDLAEPSHVGTVLRNEDLLDGMELLCEVVAVRGDTGVDCAAGSIPTIEDAGDVDRLTAFLDCVADQLQVSAAKQVITNVPATVLAGGSQTYDGERGAAVARIVSAVGSLARVPREIAANLRSLSNELKQLKNELRRMDVTAEIADERTRATVLSQASACASASAGVGQGSPFGIAAAAAQAAIACANAGMQIAIANNIRDLEREITDLERENALISIQESVDRRGTRLSDLGTELNSELAQIRASLASLSVMDARVHRLIANALMLETDSTQRSVAVNTVMRRRLSTAQVRYERAREHAIRMAFLARRAVEQRLGFDLSSRTEAMSLVEAPQRWVDLLCTLPAIDYRRLRDSTPLVQGGVVGSDAYSEAYVGDYVDRLERVVESYRIDEPFQDGSDTVVLSLRDDVTRSSLTCDGPSPNLLGHSAVLDVGLAQQRSGCGIAGTEERVPNGTWEVCGCTDADADAVTEGCVGVTALDDSVDSNVASQSDEQYGTALGYRVTFAEGTGAEFSPDARLSQLVDLDAGWYMVSWWARGIDPTLPPAEAVRVLVDGDVVAPVSESSVSGWPTPDPEWQHRYYFIVRVDSPTEAEVAVLPGATYREPTLTPQVEHAIEVGGIMLENITSRVTSSSPDAATLRPMPFAATTDPAWSPGQRCEDVTGAAFREEWTYACQSLCEEGLSSTCRRGRSFCFWEIPFSIGLDSIDTGSLFDRVGFAFGNFNYRIDSLAVNFVGTEVRNCADSPFPSSCYSAGFVPFSLLHGPPFQVRSRDGTEYSAPLFASRIEQGQGLAAERMIGNPLSSVDRGLIEPYSHRELRGRPLTGSYVLRVWDTGDVDFSAIEDVQVVLSYRYWTREFE